MQNIFMTSEVVRNVLMLQSVYMASLYNELFRYRQRLISTSDVAKKGSEEPVFKIGIIGCGQLGTMILTKILETQNHFGPIKVMVSTRQPHLLKAF